MATKQKFYVVWNGRIQGVFDNWRDCEKQVKGFEGAKYKSFESKLAADEAFRLGYQHYYELNPSAKFTETKLKFLSSEDSKPEWNSIAVDAAWNSVSKEMEYQGVKTDTGELLFRRGPFQGATNNIGEFLALVHGLAFLKKQGVSIPIYSDSITAIAWVRSKKHKSVLLPTEKNKLIFVLLQRAESWLQNNSFNNPIIKWNTKLWGEIPADFGRK
ncbi:MAG TPA: ribonuclease H family protein [Bacteroidales bacterium]|jgi:ribonuclease HI|nr:ribonuclease H [Bacteroidales bacterium]HRT13205.1 ribonuclease H family protein [Bacteroidales bacterium]